jgi:cell division septation protein DedD
MTDEGLREIQLDGKQLVFLFMAATVVAVVIFLCGVMVGRGVPIRAAAREAEVQASLDPTAASNRVPRVAPGGAGPVAAEEDLSYDTILAGQPSPDDTLRPPSEPAMPPPANQPPGGSVSPANAPKPVSLTAPKPAPPVARAAAAPAAPAAQPPAGSLVEPKGSGYVVQVAAVQKRAEANAIARRLGSKGYPTFVTTSGSNFRVRVGKYPNRREAETVASRLEREERVEPWVTR